MFVSAVAVFCPVGRVPDSVSVADVSVDVPVGVAVAAVPAIVSPEVGEAFHCYSDLSQSSPPLHQSPSASARSRKQAPKSGAGNGPVYSNGTFTTSYSTDVVVPLNNADV